MKCPFVIKKCSKCGELLVCNEINFSKNKNGKWGLRNDCKKCRCKQDKKYKKDNPQKRFNDMSNFRIENENKNSITKEQYQEMFEFFNFRCAYSGIKLNNENKSIDHVISLNKGGCNYIWNLVPCHKTCNSSKNNRSMIQWYENEWYFDLEKLQKIYDWMKYAYGKWHK